MSPIDDLVKRILESGPEIKDLDFSRITERLYFKLKAAQTLAKVAQLAVGRLRGLAESSLYDEEAKWATGVIEEIDRIIVEAIP